MTGEPAVDGDRGSDAAPSAQSLAERLRSRIRADGPITFAAFMESALYDPGDGFYATPPVGDKGAFVTSPHVAPAFGALLARFLERTWERLGRPEPFDVVEAGAGDGTLAGQILQALPTEVAAAVRYVAVDRSAGARQDLERLSRTHDTAATFTVAAELPRLPPMTGCLFANELLDNVPFHRLRGTHAGPVELCVAVDGEGFVLCEGPLSAAARRALDESPDMAPDLPPGRETVVSPDAIDIFDAALRTIDRGYVLFVDYTTADPSTTIVHGYRRHRVEADVLDDPGSKDITAGVDLRALARRAARGGAPVWGPVTQRDLLLNLGFREWDATWRDRQIAAAGGRGIEAMRIYAMRSRATLLVDPGALGGFGVLCVGRGNVPPPDEARARI